MRMNKFICSLLLSVAIPAVAADGFNASDYRYHGEAVANGTPLPYVPQPFAAYVSSDGSGSAGTWNPLTGSGGTPISYVPQAYGMYYSTDGSGAAGTWAPWNGGGGSGTITAGTGIAYYNPSGGTTLNGAGSLTGFIYGNGTSAPTAMATSVRTWTRNARLDIEATNSGTASGMYNYGDSITCYQGATTSTLGYAALIAQHLNLAVSNLPPNNYCTSGDNAQDMTFRMFSSPLNPGDSGVPIVTSMIGTNNVAGGSGGLIPFTQAQYAATAWTSVSSTNKILAGNANVTQAGTWTADATFTNANGLTSSTAASTLTYTAQVGTSGVFYVWYRNIKAGPNGVFSVSIDGTPATDTVSNTSNVNTAWSVLSNNTTTAVGLARYQTTTGSHTVVVSYVSGTINILGFGFPPTLHYRGVSGPRMYTANVPPQQNSANDATVKQYGAATQAMIQQLSSDGLAVHYVDAYSSVDPILDMTSSLVQNCPASTNPGLHPNNCGHAHIAGAFEAAINAVNSAPNSNLLAPLNTAGIPTITNLATQANGLDTASYSPSGTAFPKGSLCVDSFAGFCWGITNLGNGGGPFRTILVSNTTSGRFSFSFAPAGATPSQVISGITSEWSADGSGTLAPSITVTSTATGNTLGGKLVNFNTGGLASSISGYHNISGNGTTTTGLIQGINLWGTASNAGVHVVQNTALGVFSVGVYAPTSQVICNYFYSGTPTAASNFTCPDWVSSDGAHHFTGITFGTSANVITAAPGNAVNLARLATATPTNGNIATFDANNNIQDSGITLTGAGSAATITAGTNVTSATCVDASGSAVTCGSRKGSIQINGGTATTGTIATLSWTATSTTPVCMISQNGQGGTGTSFLDLGHTAPSTTGFAITAGITVLGVTFNVDYLCE